MKVTFEEQEYSLDIEDMDYPQAQYIFRNFDGLTLVGLMDGLTDLNAKSLGALYWLMLAQNGKVTDAGKMNFKIVKFGLAVAEAMQAEAEAEAQKTEGKAPRAPRAPR